MTMKCVATGVVLGVATMHLLPDAIETLESQAEYPLAIAIASFGILFTLAVDQVAMYFMNRLNYSTVPPHLGLIKEHGCEGGKWPNDIELGQEHNTRSHHHEEHKHSVEGTIDGSIVSGPADKSIGVSDYDHHVAVKGQEWARTNTVEEDKEINGHSHRHLHVTHDCDVLDEKLSKKVIMKAYILEVAIATHSIIIGFDYGALHSVDDLTDLKILYVAFVFHQLFEGIGLGTALSGAEKQLGLCVVASLILIFAGTFSFGILLGMFAQSSSDEAEVVAGCADALAAGILLHASMIEMLAVDFMNPVYDNKPGTKVCMYLGLIFGFGVLAMLAVWA